MLKNYICSFFIYCIHLTDHYRQLFKLQQFEYSQTTIELTLYTCYSSVVCATKCSASVAPVLCLKSECTAQLFINHSMFISCIFSPG